MFISYKLPATYMLRELGCTWLIVINNGIYSCCMVMVSYSIKEQKLTLLKASIVILIAMITTLFGFYLQVNFEKLLALGLGGHLGGHLLFFAQDNTNVPTNTSGGSNTASSSTNQTLPEGYEIAGVEHEERFAEINKDLTDKSILNTGALPHDMEQNILNSHRLKNTSDATLEPFTAWYNLKSRVLAELIALNSLTTITGATHEKNVSTILRKVQCENMSDECTNILNEIHNNLSGMKKKKVKQMFGGGP